MTRKPYPSDVSDEEWNFVAPYLALIDEQAPQRRHSLRQVFNALRWLARAGAAWRMLPNDLPPWAVVYQQFRRWSEAGCFEAMVSDMRAPSSASVKAAKASPALSSWMAEPCKAVAKVGHAPGMTGTSGATARKYMPLSIRWAT